MQNLTSYSDDELSLHVFNVESMYRARHTERFIALLGEYYIYTPAQLAVLLKDLEADKQEMQT